MRTKMSLLRELFRAGGDAVLASIGFARFFRDSRDWLQPYALYRFFCELHGCADPAAWGTRRTVAQAQVQALVDPSALHYRAVTFWYFVQYLAHVQLRGAAEHARRAGVLLQVVLSAGVPRGAADVWAAPAMFKTERSMGAPPDAFARNGQHWGFPPYAWDVMAADGYAWWRRRCGSMRLQ
jgi:4-alpha-glucanotransferase